MTAISGVELACWDLIGKEERRPVYKLPQFGGRQRDRLPAYANGWYGGARSPGEYAAKAKEIVARGYRAMKFDPFGVAWQTMSEREMADAEAIVANTGAKAIRSALTPMPITASAATCRFERTWSTNQPPGTCPSKLAKLPMERTRPMSTCVHFWVVR